MPPRVAAASPTHVVTAALSEERGTLEDVVEPFLIQQGFLVRTARGRMLAPKAWTWLGLKPPRGAATPDLFDPDAAP